LQIVTPPLDLGNPSDAKTKSFDSKRFLAAHGHNRFRECSPALLEHGYTPAALGWHKIPALYRGTQEQHHVEFAQERGKATEIDVPGLPRWKPYNGWQQITAASFTDPSDPLFHTLQAAMRAPVAGVGVLLGRGGLIAIDLDGGGDVARQIVEAALNGLYGVVVRKRGRKGFTQFVRVDPDDAAALQSRAVDAGGERVLDILGIGRQTVLPPSVHPSGVTYEWVTPDDTLLNTDLDQLPLVTGEWIDSLIDKLRDVFPGAAVVVGDGGGYVAARSAENSQAIHQAEKWIFDLGIYGLTPKRGGGWHGVAHWRSSGTGQPLERRKLNLHIDGNGIRDYGTGERYRPYQVVAAALELSDEAAQAWLAERVEICDREKPESRIERTIVDGLRHSHERGWLLDLGADEEMVGRWERREIGTTQAVMALRECDRESAVDWLLEQFSPIKDEPACSVRIGETWILDIPAGGVGQTVLRYVEPESVVEVEEIPAEVEESVTPEAPAIALPVPAQLTAEQVVEESAAVDAATREVEANMARIGQRLLALHDDRKVAKWQRAEGYANGEGGTIDRLAWQVIAAQFDSLDAIEAVRQGVGAVARKRSALQNVADKINKRGNGKRLSSSVSNRLHHREEELGKHLEKLEADLVAAQGAKAQTAEAIERAIRRYEHGLDLLQRAGRRFIDKHGPAPDMDGVNVLVDETAPGLSKSTSMTSQILVPLAKAGIPFVVASGAHVVVKSNLERALASGVPAVWAPGQMHVETGRDGAEDPMCEMLDRSKLMRDLGLSAGQLCGECPFADTCRVMAGRKAMSEGKNVFAATSTLHQPKPEGMADRLVVVVDESIAPLFFSSTEIGADDLFKPLPFRAHQDVAENKALQQQHEAAEEAIIHLRSALDKSSSSWLDEGSFHRSYDGGIYSGVIRSLIDPAEVEALYTYSKTYVDSCREQAVNGKMEDADFDRLQGLHKDGDIIRMEKLLALSLELRRAHGGKMRYGTVVAVRRGQSVGVVVTRLGNVDKTWLTPGTTFMLLNGTPESRYLLQRILSSGPRGKRPKIEAFAATKPPLASSVALTKIIGAPRSLTKMGLSAAAKAKGESEGVDRGLRNRSQMAATLRSLLDGTDEAKTLFVASEAHRGWIGEVFPAAARQPRGKSAGVNDFERYQAAVIMDVAEPDTSDLLKAAAIDGNWPIIDDEVPTPDAEVTDLGGDLVVDAVWINGAGEEKRAAYSIPDHTGEPWQRQDAHWDHVVQHAGLGGFSLARVGVRHRSSALPGVVVSPQAEDYLLWARRSWVEQAAERLRLRRPKDVPQRVFLLSDQDVYEGEGVTIHWDELRRSLVQRKLSAKLRTGASSSYRDNLKLYPELTESEAKRLASWVLAAAGEVGSGCCEVENRSEDTQGGGETSSIYIMQFSATGPNLIEYRVDGSSRTNLAVAATPEAAAEMLAALNGKVAGDAQGKVPANCTVIPLGWREYARVMGVTQRTAKRAVTELAKEMPEGQRIVGITWKGARGAPARYIVPTAADEATMVEAITRQAGRSILRVGVLEQQ
jgi:hypothetical protein